jgi:hypothetical protein
MYTTRRNDEDENTIKVSHLKPRNKHLNDVLLSRQGGRMKNPKDHSRMKEKQKLRRLTAEIDD